MKNQKVILRIDEVDYGRLEDLKRLTGRSFSQLWRDGLRLLWQRETQEYIDANNPNPKPEPKSNQPR